MLALRSAPPFIGSGEAERVAREVYGLAVAVTPLPGERDCNFHARTADARDFVLKIVDAAADPAATDCQVRALEHLAAQDPSLPVPRHHPTLTGDDLGCFEQGGVRHSTCLLSYVPGGLLQGAAIDAPLLRGMGRALGRLDRGLRGFFHPALAQNLAWDVRRLPQLAEFIPLLESEALERAVTRACEALGGRLPMLRGLRAQAIHGDGHGGNLLVDAGGVCGVLDFGDMLHAPLILEPAVAMSELLTEGLAEPDALAAVIEGYTALVPLETAEVDLLFDLITARHAVTLLVHAWRRRHDPPGATALDAASGRAAGSLQVLSALGSEALTERWHEAAGTGSGSSRSVDLAWRHRLLGAGAELFYDDPLHLVRGEGVWLYDAQGRGYLDVYNNVAHVGHAHPAVVRAIHEQAARLATHTRYLHGGILAYAEALTARCPPHLDACIFVNSGSEANDVAWRMARFATGHAGAVVMDHAYHGITHAVAALTPGAGQPQDAHVVTVPPPPATPVEAAGGTERALRLLAQRGFAPAAFFIDSALTSSGVFDPPPQWLDAIVGPLRAAGCLIVADEVQYGLGRSGSHFWGFARRGLIPDIVTLGKPLGNGYPMGAVIAPRRLIEAFQARFGFFSTFGGNPVAAAAGLAVLRVLDAEALQDNAAITGDSLKRLLRDVAARRDCLGEVRGTGLLLGVEVLGKDAPSATFRTRRIVNRLAADGVLIGSEGPSANILKLRPPMPFGPLHAQRLVRAIDEAAAVVDARTD